MDKVKIMLDAGHYGSRYNQSPVMSSYYESNFTWAYYLKLKAALEKTGAFTVLTTRTNKDENPEVYARGKMAKDCSLYVSLHSNASSNANSDHVKIYYQLGYADKSYAYESKQFAEHMSPIINGVMGCTQKAQTGTREGDNGDYYGVLRGAASVNTAAVIIEHSYHTNLRAATWLSNDNNLAAMADEACKAICAFFSVEYVQNTKKTYQGEFPTAVLKRGSKGEQVKLLQRFLNWYGNYGLDVDGSFGAKTETAVKTFQKNEGLTVDGSFGPKSLAAAKAVKK